MAAAVKAAENGHKLVSLGELLDLPLPFEDVTLPNGSTLRLYATTAERRLTLVTMASAAGDSTEAQMALVYEAIAACMTDATAEQVAALPAIYVDALMPVAFRLAGISRRQIEEAAEVLKAAPSDDSGSA